MIQLADIFQDGMILQKGKPCRVWGTSDERQTACVYVDGRRVARWELPKGAFFCFIPPQEAAFGVTVRIGNVELRDVDFGEVWVAGGQSNMEFCMKYEAEFETELEKIKISGSDAHLRYYEVAKYCFEGEEKDGFKDDSKWNRWINLSGVYDPVSKIQGERRDGVTSPIDIPVTLLDFFGVPVPADMQGHSLLPMIRENRHGRETALFGFHAGHVAITDGRYTYFRAPMANQEQNCYDYTLMPTRMYKMFSVEDLRKAEFSEPLPNSKGCRLLKVPAQGGFVSPLNFGTKLFDVVEDERQARPIDNPVLEARMATLLVQEMRNAGAPKEQFERLGLPEEGEVTAEMILDTREHDESCQTPACLPGVAWSQEAKNIWRTWSKVMPPEGLQAAAEVIGKLHAAHPDGPVNLDDIVGAVKMMLPPEQVDQSLYFMLMHARVE